MVVCLRCRGCGPSQRADGHIDKVMHASTHAKPSRPCDQRLSRLCDVAARWKPRAEADNRKKSTAGKQSVLRGVPPYWKSAVQRPLLRRLRSGRPMQASVLATNTAMNAEATLAISTCENATLHTLPTGGWRERNMSRRCAEMRQGQGVSRPGDDLDHMRRLTTNMGHAQVFCVVSNCCCDGGSHEGV